MMQKSVISVTLKDKHREYVMFIVYTNSPIIKFSWTCTRAHSTVHNNNDQNNVFSDFLSDNDAEVRIA